MASEIVVSAAAGFGLGILFDHFLKFVLDVKSNNSQFKSSLTRLEDMLIRMAPDIKKIESFNRELDRPKEIEELKGLIAKGNDLVLKCSKAHRYDFVRTLFYNKKLLKLEKSIRDYINFVLQLQISAATKENLFIANTNLVATKQVSFGVRELTDRIVQLSISPNGVGVDSSQSYGNTRLEGVCSPPELKVDPVGFNIPLSELKIKLLDDKASQHFVLSAPGGCGKTTLATALCQDRDVKEKFKSNIFFITVRELHSLLVIVNRLFRHNNCTLPESQSEEDAPNHLERLFRQIGPEPILLVLDDVWPRSESLLHKLKFRIENYKILVTSRYEFPSFGSTYKLKALNFADAMILFQKLAFPPDEQLYTPDQHILEEMVKCCRGFPLAISVVGKSLCRKSAAVWRTRLKECSKAATILSDSELLDCLQSSVEALNDKVVAKEMWA